MQIWARLIEQGCIAGISRVRHKEGLLDIECQIGFVSSPDGWSAVKETHHPQSNDPENIAS